MWDFVCGTILLSRSPLHWSVIHYQVTFEQSWGRLHANVIDYNYNYFEIS